MDCFGFGGGEGCAFFWFAIGRGFGAGLTEEALFEALDSTSLSASLFVAFVSSGLEGSGVLLIGSFVTFFGVSALCGRVIGAFC